MDQFQKLEEKYQIGDTASLEYQGILAQVFLFSYNQKEKRIPRRAEGVWSLTSRGEDYHRVIRRRLLAYAKDFQKLMKREFPFRVEVDTQEVSERYLALKAGLGFIGKNQNLISPKLGSFVYIGVIYWSMDVKDFPIKKKEEVQISCGSCELCVNACPGKALTTKGDYILESCVSFLSQDKRILNLEEMEKLGHHLYGCDLCQRVCPYNQGKEESPIEEFHYQAEEANIEVLDFLSLTNGQIKELYHECSGLWRGLGILRRNALVNAFHAYQKGNISYQEMKEILDRSFIHQSPLVIQTRAQLFAIMEDKERIKNEKR